MFIKVASTTRDSTPPFSMEPSEHVTGVCGVKEWFMASAVAVAVSIKGEFVAGDSDSIPLSLIWWM